MDAPPPHPSAFRPGRAATKRGTMTELSNAERHAETLSATRSVLAEAIRDGEARLVRRIRDALEGAEVRSMSDARRGCGPDSEERENALDALASALAEAADAVPPIKAAMAEARKASADQKAANAEAERIREANAKAERKAAEKAERKAAERKAAEAEKARRAALTPAERAAEERLAQLRGGAA